MQTLSASLRTSRLARAQAYHAALREAENGPGMTYLRQRGLTDETIRRFGLGIVDDPAPGDEDYAGRLSIPYMARSPRGTWAAMTLRFRSLGGTGPKYMSYPGDPQRMYNTVALQGDSELIAICEGEIDAISAEQAGIPAVALPGATSWQPWMADMFLGFRVVVLIDDDKAGRDYAAAIGKTLEITAVTMSGGDVNSVLVEHGEEYLKETIYDA